MCQINGLADQRIGLSFDLGLNSAPEFPITMQIDAWATLGVRVEDIDDYSTITVSRSLYHTHEILGILSVESFPMAENQVHPHAHLAVVESGLEFKLPNVIPQKYGMVTASVSIRMITDAKHIPETANRIFTECQHIIENRMEQLAAELGGAAPFTAEEIQQAVQEAPSNG